MRLTLLTAALLAAACGGSSKPAPQAPPPTNEQAVDPPPSDAPPEAAPPAGVVHRTPIGVPACDEWVHKMENYLACEAIPPETREAAQQGIDGMIQGWGDPAQWPADVRAATEASCVDATKAIQEGADALGCAI